MTSQDFVIEGHFVRVCCESSFHVTFMGHLPLLMWRCFALTDIVSVNSKCSLLEHAELSFQDMQRQGHLPDINTFNAMIALYGKRGRVDKATETLELMKTTGLAPDLVTYNCMMSMYGREGMYRRAEEVLRELEAAGETPDLVSYNTLIFSYRYLVLPFGLPTLRVSDSSREIFCPIYAFHYLLSFWTNVIVSL